MNFIKRIPFKKISLALIAVLIICQFFTIDKTNPTSDKSLDFGNVTSASAELSMILKASCYDCHSNEIKYPWYTNIAPISWWIKNHINEGTEELNFSIFGSYKSRRQDKKLKECIEIIYEGEMPMSSYTLIHRDASLTNDQKETLINFFTSLRNYESDQPKKP